MDDMCLEAFTKSSYIAREPPLRLQPGPASLLVEMLSLPLRQPTIALKSEFSPANKTNRIERLGLAPMITAVVSWRGRPHHRPRWPVSIQVSADHHILVGIARLVIWQHCEIHGTGTSVPDVEFQFNGPSFTQLVCVLVFIHLMSGIAEGSQRRTFHQTVSLSQCRDGNRSGLIRPRIASAICL